MCGSCVVAHAYPPSPPPQVSLLIYKSKDSPFD